MFCRSLRLSHFLFAFKNKKSQIHRSIPVHESEYPTARAGTGLARPRGCSCRTHPRGGSGEEVARHAERTILTATLDCLFPAGQAAETCLVLRPGLCTRSAVLPSLFGTVLLA
ncbi:unnamed protein product [Ectocarpus sp. 4 AP-2014]